VGWLWCLISFPKGQSHPELINPRVVPGRKLSSPQAGLLEYLASTCFSCCGLYVAQKSYKSDTTLTNINIYAHLTQLNYLTKLLLRVGILVTWMTSFIMCDLQKHQYTINNYEDPAWICTYQMLNRSLYRSENTWAVISSLLPCKELHCTYITHLNFCDLANFGCWLSCWLWCVGVCVLGFWGTGPNCMPTVAMAWWLISESLPSRGCEIEILPRGFTACLVWGGSGKTHFPFSLFVWNWKRKMGKPLFPFPLSTSLIHYHFLTCYVLCATVNFVVM